METKERTTREEQKIAKSSISKFRETSKKFRDKRNKAVKIKIQEKGEYIDIPKKAFFLLKDILNNMAEGKSISLISYEAEVSTQQAADMLNVSRPHIVKLLTRGEIPFKKVGTHRRIALTDLINYQRKLKENRTKQLKFLANQAQDLNLGY